MHRFRPLNKTGILIVALTLLSACTYENMEDKKFQSIGIIIGRDPRLCPSPCCGGWDISIDNQFYTFSDLPANSGIDLEKEKFPLKVKLNWYVDSVCANHIEIRKISRVQ